MNKMNYKVKLLFSGNKNGLNGAARFVRLLNNKEFWEKNRIEFSVEDNSYLYSDEEKYRKSMLFKAKSLIKEALNKSKPGKRKLIKYEFEILGKRVVDRINPTLDTCYVMNDYMVAYEFYKRYGKKYKTVFVMHNTGDMLSQVDTDMLTDTSKGGFLQRVEQIILESSDRLIFISNVALESFVRQHEQYKDKAVVVSIGLKSRQKCYHRISRPLQLVSVGTLHKRKNQIAIIQAMENIDKSVAELTLVGGGPKLEEWQRYCVDHNLESNVHLVGAKSDVYSYLEKSDIFIMSSLEEGLPVAAQEAMQSGLTLILTDVGGCRELIDGNGVLLHNISASDILKTIQEICKDETKLVKMGNRSREIFENKYTVEKMLESYLAVFNSLMEDYI